MQVFLIIFSKTEKSKTNEYVKIHKTTTEISIGATAKDVMFQNNHKNTDIKYISVLMKLKR